MEVDGGRHLWRCVRSFHWVEVAAVVLAAFCRRSSGNQGAPNVAGKSIRADRSILLAALRTTSQKNLQFTSIKKIQQLKLSKNL